jgi:uncharacterized protein (TIGR03083 family)
MDTWLMITAERTEFADFLESLTPEQWDTQTLCSEWKVRDAAAHVVLGATESKMYFVMSMIKHGFNFNVAMSRDAKAYGARPTSEIARALREHVANRTLPPGVKPPAILGDNIVHQQDCRRPLGIQREIPAERLIVALDAMKNVQPILGNRKRLAGLKLVATDLDWDFGSGPEVHGTGEALLMAMNGRRDALADLEGPGVPVLELR